MGDFDGVECFGFGLLGALIPSVCALVGSAFLVNRISEKINASKSQLPGIFFAASLGTMTYGTTAQMEIWIVLFYLWAWKEFLFQRWTRAFILVGIMAWIKGPLYPALWVMSVCIWFKFENQTRQIFSKRFIFNGLLGVGVGLLWYAVAARTDYDAMMSGFFLRENVSKMKTAQGTPWGLWGEFSYSLFPWVIWLIYSLTQKEVRNRILQQKNFYIAFALFPALFFTFFPYRVNTYLYLLTPVAAWMVSIQKGEKRSPLLGSIGIALSAVLCFFAFRLSGGNWIGVEIALGILSALLIWSYGFFSLDPKLIAIGSLLLVNFIRIGAVQIGEKDIQGLREFQRDRGSNKSLAYWIDDEDIWHEFGLVSSALGLDVQRVHSRDGLEAFLKSGGAIIFQNTPPDLNFALQCVQWSRLKKRMKFPLQTLITNGIQWDDPSVKRTYLICHS